jgi:GNAT superfamily N-acetyltransferase
MTPVTAPSDLTLATQQALPPTAMADVLALVAEAGWNQTEADWQTFLALGTIHAARTAAGRIVATAATLPYGRFGWISMVLVAGPYRRQGLATRLMRRCIDELTGARRVPVLDATPAGREVYRTLGFVDAWSYQRWSHADWRGGRGEMAPPGVAIAAIAEPIPPALCAYDAAVFGADRSPLLARLRSRLPHAALAAARNGTAVGLVLGREGRTATQIGPLIAEDEAIALALLTRSLEGLRGPVFIDVVDSKRRITAWLQEKGFAPQRPLTRMLHQRREIFDDGIRTFAVAGPEFG